MRIQRKCRRLPSFISLTNPEIAKALVFELGQIYHRPAKLVTQERKYVGVLIERFL
jgi:hypothetical protein